MDIQALLVFCAVWGVDASFPSKSELPNESTLKQMLEQYVTKHPKAVEFWQVLKQNTLYDKTEEQLRDVLHAKRESLKELLTYSGCAPAHYAQETEQIAAAAEELEVAAKEANKFYDENFVPTQKRLESDMALKVQVRDLEFLERVKQNLDTQKVKGSASATFLTEPRTSFDELHFSFSLRELEQKHLLDKLEDGPTSLERKMLDHYIEEHLEAATLWLKKTESKKLDDQVDAVRNDVYQRREDLKHEFRSGADGEDMAMLLAAEKEAEEFFRLEIQQPLRTDAELEREVLTLEKLEAAASGEQGKSEEKLLELNISEANTVALADKISRQRIHETVDIDEYVRRSKKKLALYEQLVRLRLEKREKKCKKMDLYLTESQEWAFNWYAVIPSMYREINGYLRGRATGVFGIVSRRVVQFMRQAFEELRKENVCQWFSAVEKGLPIRRGRNRGMLDPGSVRAKRSLFRGTKEFRQLGTILVEPAFLSTSYDPAIGNRFAMSPTEEEEETNSSPKDKVLIIYPSEWQCDGGLEFVVEHEHGCHAAEREILFPDGAVEETTKYLFKHDDYLGREHEIWADFWKSRLCAEIDCAELFRDSLLTENSEVKTWLEFEKMFGIPHKEDYEAGSRLEYLNDFTGKVIAVHKMEQCR